MSSLRPKIALSIGLMFACAGYARADSLLHPTPRDAMRELSTDRPDRTESPNTVPAGHYQVEMDMVSWTITESGVRTLHDLSIGNVNLKAGLLDNWDLQVVFESLIVAEVGSQPTKGNGDLTLRTKWNWVGNDSGDIAVALMPYVKVPTAQQNLGNGKWEAGWILPVGFALRRGWGVVVMLEYDLAWDGVSKGYEPVMVGSATTAHSLLGDLGGYVEVFSEVPVLDTAQTVYAVDGGLTLAVGEYVQLDGGLNYGINNNEINPFVGVSFRY